VKTIAVLLLLLTATAAFAGDPIDPMEVRGPWLKTDNTRVREALTFMAIGAQRALNWAMQARGCTAKPVTGNEFMDEVDFHLLKNKDLTPKAAILVAYASVSGCKDELMKMVDDAMRPRS
jgi:hypothetical protein